MHCYPWLAKTTRFIGYAVVLAMTVSGVKPVAQQPPAASSQKPQQGVDWNPQDPDRVQAFQLFEQHKLPAAAMLLETVVAKYPRDVVAHERLGTALLSRSSTQSDPDKRKADRLQARAELMRARELGDNSDPARRDSRRWQRGPIFRS